MIMITRSRNLKRNIAALFCALAFVSAALYGCAADNASVRHADYRSELDRWTAAKEITRGFELRLAMKGTFKSLPFREAYVDQYVKSYKLDAAQRALLLARQSEDYEKYNEFFISVFTSDMRWNDLDAKGSIWRLYLEDDKGVRLLPISIKKVDRSDPVLRELYPYFDPWSAGYAVIFPKYSETGSEPVPNKDAKYVKLIVTGLPGEAELVWQMK